MYRAEDSRADLCSRHVAGRKLLQFQGASIYSLLNSGQLNSAAVQQLAQAFAGSATNLAGVSQTNVNLGRKLLNIQGAGVFSLFNSGQLNQAAVQQLAQAVFGSATNGAVVSQGNLNGAAPRVAVSVAA